MEIPEEVLPPEKPTALIGTDDRLEAISKPIYGPMAALRVGSKYSHTTVYAPFFRHPAPCPRTQSEILKWLLRCDNQFIASDFQPFDVLSMLFTVYLVLILNMLDLDLILALWTIVPEAGSYLHVATAQVTRYFHGIPPPGFLHAHRSWRACFVSYHDLLMETYGYSS